MSEAIERIYDRLIADEKLKTGTKFERLAAFVFQILDRSALVVHDVKLRGPGKEAEHQIDVTATDGLGKEQRVIVETRDRADPVGLGQVRDFFGVIHQLRPNQASIVSATGFTDDAKKYARDEGIRLAVLRPTKSAEDNRLKSIHFTLNVRAMGIPTITSWLAADDAELARLREAIRGREGDQFLADADAETFFDASGARVACFREVLEPIFHSLELELVANEGRHEFSSVRCMDLAGVHAVVRGFTYRVDLSESVTQFTVGNASSVTELIFRSIEGTVEQELTASYSIPTFAA